MIKYPLAVTIDTNIFDAAKYDFSEKSIAIVQIETNDINDPVLIDNLCKPVVSAIRKYRIIYNYIILLRDTLCITEETDERLLGYYQSLVGFAEISKDVCENPDYYFDLGIRKHKNIPNSLFSTKEDYEALIEKYTNLIEQILGQEYHP